MSQKLKAVAAQLFCHPIFQNHLKNSSYNPSRTMECAIAGAKNFIEVCDEKQFTGNPMVPLAYYASRLGDWLFDYKDAQMKELAAGAIDIAVEFEMLFAQQVGDAPEPLVKQPEPSTEDAKLVDLPIEQCNLPTTIVETLVAAGHATANAVITADAQGKIVGLPGIGAPTRDKLLTKLKEALKEASAPKTEVKDESGAPSAVAS